MSFSLLSLLVHPHGSRVRVPFAVRAESFWSSPSGGKSTIINVAAGLVEVVFSTDVFSGVIPGST